MALKIKIHTLDKTLFEGEAVSVTLPGTDGEIGVLSAHVPLINSLRRGTIRLRTLKEEKNIEISGGFVEVQPDSRVVVLAD